VVKKTRNEADEKPLTALRAWMTARGVTQKRLARSCGISEAVMSKALAGKHPLSMDNVFQLAAMTDLDPRELVANGRAKKTLELWVKRLRSKDRIAKDSANVA
jgi:transcriptional regulator with XRE-family HTH domain